MMHFPKCWSIPGVRHRYIDRALQWCSFANGKPWFKRTFTWPPCGPAYYAWLALWLPASLSSSWYSSSVYFNFVKRGQRGRGDRVAELCKKERLLLWPMYVWIYRKCLPPPRRLCVIYSRIHGYSCRMSSRHTSVSKAKRIYI